jgi:flagellar hook assembly protein FlgD
MSVSAVGYLPSTNPNTDAKLQLSQQDFLKILVENLKQQDPFKPQDGANYYKDIMTLSTYQSTLALERNTDKLVNAQGLDLVGQTVEFYDPQNNGAPNTGVVSQVNFDQDGAYVTIGSQTIDLGYVYAVKPAAPTAPVVP